jgi:hypothetical protein
VHLSKLKLGKHPCHALQRDWLTYGANAFGFCILDSAPRGLFGGWGFGEWRDYLERKRIAEHPLVYNVVKVMPGNAPRGVNPYRAMH